MSTLVASSPTGLFRAHYLEDLHDPGADGETRGIFLQLAQEWVRLAALPSMTHTVRRWERAEPALGGAASLGGLVDKIDSSHDAQKDEILLALVRLAQGGQQLAGRVLLQAMLPKIARMVRTMRPSNNDDRWLEDRRHIAVATFWEVLHGYPAQRRQSRVAANLALDTLHRLTSNLRKPPGDVPVDPAAADQLAAAAYQDPRLGARPLSDDADLLEVLSWGLDVEAISREEAALLVRVYLPDGSREHGPSLADELGLSQAALRQRCSRARRRLVAAVRADAHQHSPVLAAIPA